MHFPLKPIYRGFPIAMCNDRRVQLVNHPLASRLSLFPKYYICYSNLVATSLPILWRSSSLSPWQRETLFWNLRYAVPNPLMFSKSTSPTCNPQSMQHWVAWFLSEDRTPLIFALQTIFFLPMNRSKADSFLVRPLVARVGEDASPLLGRGKCHLIGLDVHPIFRASIEYCME